MEPPARLNIRTAYQWYEERAAGLGSEFLRAVAAAVERLERGPLAFKLERQKYRRVHLHKFPYALHYTVADAGRVFVLACLHFRQSPDAWPGA
ncbi:MAG TPA: type II toxin-antitoxin system RelE/ParE family toxin [Burkholderiaceae bacterium]|nr:type II toxin-antitoxin system RelE/ParE family toxin [Burkholderiaceae bacterium]